jgi:hypothetical protein
MLTEGSVTIATRRRVAFADIGTGAVYGGLLGTDTGASAVVTSMPGAWLR